MSTGKAIGSVLVGLTAHEVDVTATLGGDTPRFGIEIHGMPEAAARETRVRVRSAIAALGVDLPRGASVHVELPEGASAAPLDLAIAVAILRARDACMPTRPVQAAPDALFIGELAFDGRVRTIRGALCHASLPRDSMVFPEGNALEVGTADRAIGLVGTLADVLDGPRHAARVKLEPHVPHGAEEIRGNTRAAFEECRAAQANGARAILLVGPPGSGKTMIARRLASELAPMTQDEMATFLRIHGAAGLLGNHGGVGRPGAWVVAPPFRAPHHTVSEAGLVGGGEGHPRAGEVTLAHHGVLFLDEVTEFRLTTLDPVAWAVKGGLVRHARRGYDVTFPASPKLVVLAANPCPCGYAGMLEVSACRCSREALERHASRLTHIRERFGAVRVDVPRFEIGDDAT